MRNNLEETAQEDGTVMYEYETRDVLGESAIHLNMDYGSTNIWLVYDGWSPTQGGIYKCVYIN